MRAIFSVSIDGQDISPALNPILLSFSVTDNAGASSDTASLEIDDTGGRVIMPSPGAGIVIMLGWEGSGLATVFEGVVDTVNAAGDRGGRKLSISAKGMDTRSKAKQGQRRHFDDATIEKALGEAGRFAGITVAVDPAFASIKRPYIALQDESFVAFGERIARELGGTFKISGDKAVLAKRSGGSNPSGAALPTVTATWGDNLHSYSISPILGRPVEKEAVARWYDPAETVWKTAVAQTGTEGAQTTKLAKFIEADGDRAAEQANSDAAESDRRAGRGSVTIEGNTSAQAEGTCIVANCRPGVDGKYRIESRTHNYARSGFVTSLELCQPKEGAGKDARSDGKTKAPKSDGSGDAGDGLALPRHPTLG